MDFKESDVCNIALEVGGEKLWVSPQELARKSPVFHAMFFQDFKEKAQTVVEMTDHSNPHIMKKYLILVCDGRPKGRLTFESTEEMFKIYGLSDKFQTNDITEMILEHISQQFDRLRKQLDGAEFERRRIPEREQNSYKETMEFLIYCWNLNIHTQDLLNRALKAAHKVPFDFLRENKNDLGDLYSMILDELRTHADQLISNLNQLQGTLRMDLKNWKDFMDADEDYFEVAHQFMGELSWDLCAIVPKDEDVDGQNFMFCSLKFDNDFLSNKLEIYLDEDLDSPKSWSFQADVVFKIISQREGIPNLERTMSHLFCSEEEDYKMDCDDFVADAVLLNPENGFIVDDTVIFEVFVSTSNFVFAPQEINDADNP